MNTNTLFLEAQELMQAGQQKESIAILRSLAIQGHVESIRIIAHIESLHNLSKKFPVNPLAIVDNEDVNRHHQIPNLVHLYEQDVIVNLGRLQSLNNGLTPDDCIELLVYQTISNLIEYKNKSLDVLPIAVIEQVTCQIRQAFVNVYIDRGYCSSIVDKYEKELKEKIWNPGIVEETETYMYKLDNKHFM
jgi:hypothetical protein